MRSLHWLIFLALALAVGCNSAPPAQTVDKAADEQAIRDLAVKWAAAVEKRDLDAIMALYTSDATAAWPDAPAIHGAEGIRADQQAQASSFVKSLRLVFDRDTVTVTQGGISNTGRYKLHHEDTASIVIYSGEGELEPQTFTFAADKQLRWAMSDDRSILFTPSGR